jgi:hypothetical protein
VRSTVSSRLAIFLGQLFPDAADLHAFVNKFFNAKRLRSSSVLMVF